MQMQSVWGARFLVPPVSSGGFDRECAPRSDSSRPARFAYANRVLNSQVQVQRGLTIRDETLIGLIGLINRRYSSRSSHRDERKATRSLSVAARLCSPSAILVAIHFTIIYGVVDIARSRTVQSLASTAGGCPLEVTRSHFRMLAPQLIDETAAP